MFLKTCYYALCITVYSLHVNRGFAITRNMAVGVLNTLRHVEAVTPILNVIHTDELPILFNFLILVHLWLNSGEVNCEFRIVSFSLEQ